MLIAVGMYLPFNSTSAIFVGGALKWILDKLMERRQATAEQKTKAENTGVLVSSGFIAGESLMAVTIALVYGAASVLRDKGSPWLFDFREMIKPDIEPYFLLSLIGYPLAAAMLIWLPLKVMRRNP